MKKFTVILLSLGLFSFAVHAQTKPKTTVKPIDAKTTNAKSVSVKQATAKPANVQSKNSPPEKTSPEKPKPVKSTPAKPQPAKHQSNKVQSDKFQTVKLRPAGVKIAAKSNAKSVSKTEAAMLPAKIAPKSIVKPAIKSTVTRSTAKLIAAAPPRAVAKPVYDAGEIVGKTYANKYFNFSLTLPDDWEIAEADFERRLKKEGFNLSVETPKAASASAQSKLNAAANRVRVLLTAYKAAPDAGENAILRVSIEDLRAVPQVKDAVDYFDSMRATYQNIKLPAGFKYSETQAERVGAMQFGFLDVSNGAGKKRMYATVRNGHALMFTLTYKSDEDLNALKNFLSAGDFKRR